MNNDQPKAEHGAKSEVTWDGGKGRQPYANQGREETGSAAAGAFAEGDRGDLSGRNVEQLEQVRGKPGSDHVEQHQQHNRDDRDAE